MKLILSILSLVFLTVTNVIAQKLYVWCPKEQLVKPRLNFLSKDTIDIVLFDGRVLTKNSKVECTPENTLKSIGEFIRKTYPDAVSNLQNTSHYFADPVRNRITIKIGVSAFHAAFGADVKLGIGGNLSFSVFPDGKWNAVTAYSVKLYDYRNNKELKSVREIQKVASKSNTGGYRTAKNILNTTYMEASQELLFFIDETFMK